MEQKRKLLVKIYCGLEKLVKYLDSCKLFAPFNAFTQYEYTEEEYQAMKAIFIQCSEDKEKAMEECRLMEIRSQEQSERWRNYIVENHLESIAEVQFNRLIIL